MEKKDFFDYSIVNYDKILLLEKEDKGMENEIKDFKTIDLEGYNTYVKSTTYSGDFEYDYTNNQKNENFLYTIFRLRYTGPNYINDNSIIYTKDNLNIFTETRLDNTTNFSYGYLNNNDSPIKNGYITFTHTNS